MEERFFIGELSRRTGIPSHTVRYYEQLGLIDPPERTEAKYRVYSEQDETRLRFIEQAKLFGLSLTEIKKIIKLKAAGIEPCAYVKDMIRKHLDDLDRRIQEMVTWRDTLASWYDQVKSTPDICTGTVCGLIEDESPFART